MSESYIGKAPQYGFFEKQRITTANGVLTEFNLAFTCADSNQLLVSVGGVIQEGGISYTVLSGTPQQISFTEAPATGVEIFIVWLGKQTSGPEFASGMITGKAALGTSPASDDQFLVYDTDASVLKKVAYSNVHSGVADMAANTVKVRDANSTGTPSDKVVADTQLLIGDGTGFTAATLSGDVTMANTGAVTIAANAIDAGKLANNAVDTTAILDNNVTLAKIADGTQGGTLYFGASGAPSELAAGTSGKFLKTQGSGANPVWDDVPAGAPTGGGTDKIFFENGPTVTTAYTLTANYNAVSAGPVAVTATVTLTGTSEWVIV